MTQPFALFIKNIFEEQDYPDLTKYPHAWQGLVRIQKFPDAYLPPYDMAGWTLPYQMGVNVATAAEPLKMSLSPLEKVVPPAGKVASGAGYAYLLCPKTNNSFIAVNRILIKGGQVQRAKDSFTVGGKTYPPGTFVVPSRSVSSSFTNSLAKELFLDIGATGGSVSAKTFKLKTPKVALYKSWTASMDEGWTRWLFEQFEFSFTNIHDADVRAGNLRERFDVIVIPAMSTDAIVNGHRKGTMPMQYVGGITKTGVQHIKKFIEEGGTLVTLNSGSLFAIDELGVAVSDALKDVRPVRRQFEQPSQRKPPKFACPGSILRMDFNNKHPVAYGMPAEAPALFTRSPAFNISSTFEGEKAPITVGDSMTLVSCAKLMLSKGISSLIVTHKNSTDVKVITKTDIVEHYSKFYKKINKVKDYMTTPVYCISPDELVIEAMRILLEEKVSRIVVIKDDKAIGILTGRDLLPISSLINSGLEKYSKKSHPGLNIAISGLKGIIMVGDIMRSSLFTIFSPADLRDAAKIMIRNRISGIPVVDKKDKLIGIITKTDIIRAFSKSS